VEAKRRYLTVSTERWFCMTRGRDQIFLVADIGAALAPCADPIRASGRLPRIDGCP
jgi:hypothetical protein